MSFFEELENILSKAKAENSAPETAEEPAQPPVALAPVGLALAPALSVSAPVLSTPAPVATEVASVPTIVEPLATVKPALSLAVPAPLTLAPAAPIAEVSTPTLTASASAGLPSRPSFSEKLPSLSLATEEPQEEEPVKTVRPSLVAASIAEVLSANKPTGLPVRPDTEVSVPRTENIESPVSESAPDIEEEGEEWDGVALPSADSLVVAQAPILAAKAEVVSADPQNYIAAVSHAEDVTIRTNSLPEIKPAGQEYFFEDDDDEPVVF